MCLSIIIIIAVFYYYSQVLLFRIKPKFKLGLLVGGLLGTVLTLLAPTSRSNYRSLFGDVFN